MKSKHRVFLMYGLHPIGLPCQDINDKLSVLQLPFSHLSIRVNGQLNIIFDILQLSPLVVYRNGKKRQGFKDNFDVSLRAASDTYMQVQEI